MWGPVDSGSFWDAVMLTVLAIAGFFSLIGYVDDTDHWRSVAAKTVIGGLVFMAMVSTGVVMRDYLTAHDVSAFYHAPPPPPR
jgi:hypothetical protein